MVAESTTKKENRRKPREKPSNNDGKMIQPTLSSFMELKSGLVGLRNSGGENAPSTPTRKEEEGQGPLPDNKNGSSVLGKGLWPRKLKSGSLEHILWQKVRFQDTGGGCMSGSPGNEENRTAMVPRIVAKETPSPEREKGEKFAGK